MMSGSQKVVFGNFGQGGREKLTYGMKPVKVNLSPLQQRTMERKLEVLDQRLGINAELFMLKDIDSMLKQIPDLLHSLFPKNLDLMKVVVNKGGDLSVALSEGIELADEAFSLEKGKGLVRIATRRNHTIFVPDLFNGKVVVLTFENAKHNLNEAAREKYGLVVSELKRAGKIKTVLCIPLMYGDFDSGKLRNLGAIILASKSLGSEFLDVPGDLAVAREFANFVACALNNFV